MKILPITSECLISFMQQIVGTQEDLPSDSKVVATEYDFETRSFSVFIESETFSEVAEGERIQRIHPVFSYDLK